MKQNIPSFSLSRQWDEIKQSITPKINALLDSNQFIGGPYVANFEKAFAEYIRGAAPREGTASREGTAKTPIHAIGCNSGTDALWLALKALDIMPNSIVLTTPFSFIASSSEIVDHGAHPVFIDIDESYNISPTKIEHWLKLHTTVRGNQTFHTKTNRLVSGIITVDLFGQCADYKEIKRIAKEWNLWIIEDACQAIGSHINNVKAGTFGDISCFSLYPTKNLGVFGDGGVITTGDPLLAEKLFKLRNHGRKSHYNYECYGRNSRIDAIQALIATEKLGMIDKLNNRRREIAHTYTKRLAKLPFLKIPVETMGHHVYHRYSVQVADEFTGICSRDELRQYLQEQGVGTGITYPKALHQIEYLQPPRELATSCPVTEMAVKNIFDLPVWPELTDKEVQYVCSVLENVPLFTASTKNNVKRPTVKL